MGEQRQRFSFRLPWSAPPAPPTRRPAPGTNNPSRATSSNNQPNANPTATSQKSPSQSSGSSQTPRPLSRASTSTKTSSKPTPSESPNVTPQSAIKTKSPAPTSTPPSQPVAEIQRPSSTAPQPIRPASQTSPSRSPEPEQLVGRTSPLQDQAPQKQPPSSPAPANLQSRTSSQTSTQSRAGTQRRATSESLTPSNASPQSRPHSRTSIKPKNTSQSPLTSHRKSTVSETDSQPSSPAPSQHKNSSSEKIIKNMQPTAGAPTQTGSPSKIINPREGSLPSPTSSNPSSPMSKNQNQALSQSQLQAPPEKDITDEMISKAPIEATVKPVAVAPSQQSDPPSTIPTLMAAEEMTEKYKEVMHSNPPMLYGKQSKSTASHQSNRNRAGASRQKPVASNGEGISTQKEITNDISKLTQKMASEQQGKPVSVITLVGENKGATMQLGSQKEGAVHIHRGYKLNPDESTEAATNGEESSKDKRPKEDQMTKAYMNSNTQGINNSIVFKSSITERNPGVHLTLTQYPTDPIETTTNENQLVAQKAEANITPSHKLTYDTTIRRRCLRGLLMESSDSDPDNPEKPRRHGCRCSFGDLNKDKEIDLL